MSVKRSVSGSIILIVTSLAASAHSADKREDARAACVAAADRGQVARDQGKLSAARVEFTDCSRSACPSVVAKQCTEWLGEVNQDMPTLTFRALDDSGKETLDVTVYVDSVERKGSLDSVPLEVDPGVHTFRFVHAGSADVLQQVIVRPKEKGRVIDAKFSAAPVEKPQEHHHPFRFPWTATASFVIGAASFIGMGVLAGTAAHDANALRETCAPTCVQADVDWINTRILLANVALGVGIGFMGLFTLSLVIGNVGSSDDAPKASLVVGPGSLGFQGQF
jgi:hypothetical protein